MAVNNRIAGYFEEMKGWRQHLHQNPELDLQCHETAAFVVERLREFGVDSIDEGWAETGVVALIKGRGDGPTIGLRADMDALPIHEATGLDYASKVDGKMHACGHDGHTTMLLGAAKYLAETRNFAGTVALIFQPAEETIGGARIMCEEGLIGRYGIKSVYAMHSLPDLPIGQFETCKGPIMAAADDFRITVQGRGGHAAHPDTTVDPIAVGAQIYQGLQTIVSRNIDPIETGVLSVTIFQAGSATNVIPDSAELAGTIRTFAKPVQKLMRNRMENVSRSIAQAYGATIDIEYTTGYPATINFADETDFAIKIAGDIVGSENVEGNTLPTMGAEDFAFMLEECPGAYVYIGNGPGAALHHPEYNFNDDATPIGASYFARLVETGLPIRA